MSDEHVQPKAAWVETSALAAPAILGASAGVMIGDMMNSNARRGFGIALGIVGIAALLPFAVDGVAGLITGPRSKFGVNKKIQKIRDAGIGSPSDDVERELDEQGVI